MNTILCRKAYGFIHHWVRTEKPYAGIAQCGEKTDPRSSRSRWMKAPIYVIKKGSSQMCPRCEEIHDTTHPDA